MPVEQHDYSEYDQLIQELIELENKKLENIYAKICFDNLLIVYCGNYLMFSRVITMEEAEHMIATRLYQNTAKVHFNDHTEKEGRFGKRLMYGGHVISMARALSFNGLANGFHIPAINGGRHVSPCFAGDTIYAWSEILDKQELSGRSDVGALRTRTIAAKNQPCSEYPDKTDEGYDPSVMLDLDYWLIMPR